nr:shikimate dehydrogenase [Oceanibacterium hippocampi]
MSGKARVAGVMGWPVAHSRSPRLHGYWLAHYRIDGAYIPLAVRPEAREAAFAGLRALGLAGCNVTIPHKEAALGLVDELDDQARRIGAVNTVIVGDDGRLIGRNTDAFGFREALLEGAPALAPEGGVATVLGAGGAARAIIVALQDLGLGEIRVVNRGLDRARALAAEFGRPVEAVVWDERAGALDGAGLLVNSTSLGMAGSAPLELALDALPPAATVMDIVYTPLETPLLAEARARGHRAVDGLGMLLHQARPGFEAWFGHRPEVTAALRAHVLDDGNETA